MSRASCSALGLLLALAGGCAQLPQRGLEPSAPAGPSALLYVYLDSWPPEAEALIAKVGAMSAVLEDGREAPLAIALAELGRASAGTQVLLARGRVPPGRVVALKLVTASATVRGSDGKTVPLRLAEEPGRAVLDLPLGEHRGGVVDLRLDARAALEQDGVFRPVFRAVPAVRPGVALLGLVSAWDGSSVLILDKRTGRVGGVVPTGRRPLGLVIDRERRRAYVAAAGEDAVETIDLEQGAVSERRPLRGGDEPFDLALTPDRRTLLVVNRGSSTLSFLDPDGLLERDRLDLGAGLNPGLPLSAAGGPDTSPGSAPNAIEIDRDGRLAYITNSRGANVMVVDIPARRVGGTIAVEPGPIRPELDRTQTRLWVLHEDAPFLTLVDVRSLAVERRLSIDGRASALCVDPLTDQVYVARQDGTAVDVYDPRSLLPVDALPVAGRAVHLALEPEGKLLVAALPDQGAVAAVSLVGRRAAWRAEVPDGPAFLAFTGGK